MVARRAPTVAVDCCSWRLRDTAQPRTSFAKRSHGLQGGGPIDERANQSQIEIREQLAAIDQLVTSLLQDMDDDATVPPEPDFGYVQAPINLELVEAPTGPQPSIPR